MYTMSYAAFPLIRLAVRSTPSPVWEKAFIVVLFLAAKIHCCIDEVYKGLLLEEKVGGFSRSDEARNPPLWQIKADAAPMRQRVLLALASQNDYAEL